VELFILDGGPQENGCDLVLLEGQRPCIVNTGLTFVATQVLWAQYPGAHISDIVQ